MYPSGGGGAYGQQTYATQQGYGQSGAPSCHGATAKSPDSIPARHSGTVGGPQDAHLGGGYRRHASGGVLSGDSSMAAPAQYGVHYGSAYGAPQLDVVGGKRMGLSELQDRVGSSQFSSGDTGSSFGLKASDYIPSSDQAYSRKSDQFAKSSEYLLGRDPYVEKQSTYIGRGLQSESTRIYSDYSILSQRYQSDPHDQVPALHRQPLQTDADGRTNLSDSAVDSSIRPSGYLAARSGTAWHGSQDPASYSTRMDADGRSFSALGASSYAGQHPALMLGAGGRTNLDDLYITHGSSGSGYGVGLPPGRDYSSGKALGNMLNYAGDVSSRASHPSLGGSRMEDRKVEQTAFRHEFDIREDARLRDHAREREKEREREREKEKERERERERGRERERERERARTERREERDRERKNDRERQRERDRERDVRREHTPPRIIKTQHASKEHSLRKEPTSHEVVHRRPSPLKESRREYIRKVHPFCLVDTERDFLSLTKRYPRLHVSSEFSKLVVYWPKHNLNVSLHIPVSFEHDITEINGNSEQKKFSKETTTHENLGKSNGSKTVWNAKVILLSGISSDAFEDLSSNKSFRERPPHYNNILRLAVLKKYRCFMAIGGSWSSEIDGGDPLLDYTVLIQTALRHVKEITRVDLSSCIQWNRFLEIHYDRVGKNGLFSHKEISVYFIPNLSDCLPTLDVWQSQWLAQKEAKLETEQLSLKREKNTSSKKNDPKGNSNHDKPDDGSSPETIEGITMNLDAVGQSENVKAESSVLKDETVKDTKEGNYYVDKEKKSGANVSKTVPVSEEKDVKADQKHNENSNFKEALDSSVAQNIGTEKSGKKPTSKKVVKKAAPVEEEKDVEADMKQNENSHTIEETDHSERLRTEAQKSGKKTVCRKTFAKKGVTGKDAPMEEKGKTAEGRKIESKDNETDTEEPSHKTEPDAAEPKKEVEKTQKRKVTKKTVKRKVVSKAKKGSRIQVDNLDNKVGFMETDNEGKGEVNEKLEVNVNEDKSDSNVDTILAKEKDAVDTVNEEEATYKCDEQKENGKKQEAGIHKHDDPNNDHQSNKNIEEDKGKDCKDVESREKSSKEEKPKRILEKPPKCPGLFLKISQTKELKLRSTTFSLDGLLDYSERDTEESTFELSLFGEVLYEMLQYQMGCLILAYLERLRLKYVNKRNEQKRPRDENPDKGSEDERSAKKRSKSSDKLGEENNSSKDRITEGETLEPKMEASAVEQDETRNATNNDQEMKDAGSSDERCLKKDEKEMVDNDKKIEMVQEIGPDEKVKMDGKPNEATNDKKTVAGRVDKVVKEIVIDKKLLQAFHYFDRNRIGYIKVEDMRTIVHNLGKFHSNRDVKELVHNALLESSTARDDRIFYEKLVVLSDS